MPQQILWFPGCLENFAATATILYSVYPISQVSTDVSAGSRALDNDALIYLAHRYPKLKEIILRETCYIGSPGVITLFQNCPDFRYIEITRGISAEQCITATTFD
jgi:hypothetical protein